MVSYTTYLIDRNGTVNYTWPSTFFPGEGVRWLGDNTLLRTIKVGAWGAGGAGGGVQIVQPDGTVTWDFRYSSSSYLAHHDVRMLPNGDILLVAWEVKTRQDALDHGRDPNKLIGNVIWPDHIIEVKPTGPTSGDIVWQWHAWGHLIQDYDPAKANYGDVAAHPELIDINYGDYRADWLHCNSLDYNAKFDQILISCPNFNEIWIIDHNTTTEEAAGHTGGQYGKGGDLLYRWGNPQAYKQGTSNDEIFIGQHDSTWIRGGLPGAGHILVFNNGVNRYYSSVDEFIPPVNDTGVYTKVPGQAYGPTNLTWTYMANPPTSFYSYYIGGAERLPNGDTLICNGANGYFFEVTPDKTTVWSYQNPYPSGLAKDTFKIVYIPPPAAHGPNLDASGSLTWKRVKPGETMTGSFTVRNIGDTGSLLNWTVNTSSLTWGSWTFTPSNGSNLTPQAGSIIVQVSVVAPSQDHQKFQGYIRVRNVANASDYADIPVTLTTPLDQGIHGSAPWFIRLLMFPHLCLQFILEKLKEKDAALDRASTHSSLFSFT